MMFRLKKRFSPSLIDLGKYEQSLLSSKAKGTKPVPIRPIPIVMPGWTDRKMASMEKNGEKAKTIFSKIFGDG